MNRLPSLFLVVVVVVVVILKGSSAFSYLDSISQPIINQDATTPQVLPPASSTTNNYLNSLDDDNSLEKKIAPPPPPAVAKDEEEPKDLPNNMAANLEQVAEETPSDHYAKNNPGAGWAGYQHSKFGGYLNHL